MTMRHFLISLAAFLLFLTASMSCSSRQSDSQLPSLRLGAMSSLDYIPYVVAQKVGIYDSLGLDLEIVKFFSANDRDAAFRSGQVDGTVIDYTGAAIQHAAGMDIALITRHDGYFEFMAQPSIQGLEELKGKKIGVSRNTVIEYATDRMLASVGIKPEEVQKMEVNKIPLRMELMIAGEMDASIFPDPFISMSRTKGFKSLASTHEMGIYVTGSVFSRKSLDEKRASVELLLQGYNLAVDYMKAHPRSEWQQILVDDAMVPEEMAVTLPLPDYRPATTPSPLDIKETIAWLHQKELVPDEYAGEGLVDSSFLPSAK